MSWGVTAIGRALAAAPLNPLQGAGQRIIAMAVPVKSALTHQPIVWEKSQDKERQAQLPRCPLLFVTPMRYDPVYNMKKELHSLLVFLLG